MEKLIITAAICGAEVTKKQQPKIPYTVDEVVEEACSAYNAGASIIHLHVRKDDGTPTQDASRFKACIDGIKTKCPDVIIQPSTGGSVGMTVTERSQPLLLNPEMATIDCGTLNFGGDDIFINTENQIKEFSKIMEVKGVFPELECFDKSMIETVLRLRRKGHFNHPLHFSFVMGVPGGIGGTLRDFTFLRGSIPSDATYSVAGIGRFEYPLACASIIDGGHVRVGFEDNIYLRKGHLARSNGELVEKVVRLSTELGREIATPEEARRILGISEMLKRREQIVS